MKCDFCKRDEDEIKEIFSPIFKRIEDRISLLENKINNIKEEFSLVKGFTKDNFDRADKINNAILDMKIKTVFDSGDTDKFINIDVNVEILRNYYKDFNPDIAPEKSLMELLIMFKKEPTEERLEHEKSKLKTNKNSLTKLYIAIKSQFGTFDEIDAEFDIPLNVFDFDDAAIASISTIKQMKPDKKLKLCPYCKYLFKGLGQRIALAEKNMRMANEKKHGNNILIKKDSIPMYPSWDTND
jgi:hypothetical protein